MSLRSFAAAADAAGLDVHAVGVWQNGRGETAYWAPYRAEARHVLYSMTKTVTGLGALFAVQEGHLSLDDTLVSFFSRWSPRNPDDRWHRVTLRHLLTMTLGFERDRSRDVQSAPDWVRAALALPLDEEPGTRFVYSNLSSYLVSAMVQAAVGLSLREFLLPRLFQPLGIDPPWDACPRGRSLGESGLYLTLEESLRVGRVLLDRGVWNGRRLLDEALLADAAAFHVATGTDLFHDSHQGYGYQLWRCRFGAFRADGAFGQLLIVHPDRRQVVALHAGVRDTQPLVDLVWEHFDEIGEVPGALERRPPEAAEAGTEWADWAGTWELNDHPRGWTELALGGPSGRPWFSYRDDRGLHEVPFGWGCWVESRSRVWRHDFQKRRLFVTCASGSLEPGRLTLTMRFPEQAPVVTLRFTRGTDLQLAQRLSVSMVPTSFVVKGVLKPATSASSSPRGR